MEDTQYAYAGEIFKYDKTSDGLMVYGKAAGPDLDLDGQICDPDWLKQAMPDWMRWGNIRAQHGPVAAGVGKELSADGDSWMLKALIVDAESVKKVEAGVYKGFSVGIKGAKIVRDDAAPNGRIVGGTIVENSLVDRPCNPTALMGIAKAVGVEMSPVDVEGEPLFKVAAVDEPSLTDRLKALTADLRKYDETADIAGATQVMSQIGSLIESEASELAKGRDEEAVDISILLDAMQCMTRFRARERQQDGDDDGTPADDSELTYAALGAEGETEPVAGEVEKRDFSQKERDEAADNGDAMPDGSFPIHTRADLKNAIHLAGNAKDPAAARRHIKQRAKDLGASDMIPDSWGDSSKSATADDEQPADLMKWATADNVKAAGLVTADEMKTALEQRDSTIQTLTEQAEADRKVIGAQEEAIKALRADVAKVLASPVPGGPVIMRAPHARTQSSAFTQADRYEALAKRHADDQYLSAGLKELAANSKE